jgi:hypothetical protein
MIIDVDANLEDADWTKQTWDIPASDIEELREFLRAHRMTVREFKRKPVYKLNVGKPGFAWLKQL